jgi:hypothetical protein
LIGNIRGSGPVSFVAKHGRLRCLLPRGRFRSRPNRLGATTARSGATKCNPLCPSALFRAFLTRPRWATFQGFGPYRLRRERANDSSLRLACLPAADGAVQHEGVALCRRYLYGAFLQRAGLCRTNCRAVPCCRVRGTCARQSPIIRYAHHKRRSAGEKDLALCGVTPQHSNSLVRRFGK